MSYPDYVRAHEYKSRLERMLQFGRSHYSGVDFEVFASPIRAKIDRIEAQMAEYEASASGIFCAWIGVRSFSVARQIPRQTASILWNSPLISKIPVTQADEPIQKELFLERRGQFPSKLLTLSTA